jgi:hypothetical protein
VLFQGSGHHRFADAIVTKLRQIEVLLAQGKALAVGGSALADTAVFQANV